jgi:Acetyltransferase (GNAT) domain
MTNKFVKKVVPANGEEWDGTWEQCDYATYFHSREWAEIWSLGNPKYKPDARLVLFEDGKTAILPLSRQKRYRGLAHSYWSSPGGTYGGWISADALNAEHAAALVEILVGMGSARWRVNPYDGATSPPSPLSASREGELKRFASNGEHWDDNLFESKLLKSKSVKIVADETQVLALDGDFDAIFKHWTKGHRSAAKKAAREGVTARCASTLDDWGAYYDVYKDSLRRWGEHAHGQQPWALFEAMHARKSVNIRLWLAEYQGVIIGGALCFYAPRHVVYWHGAALEAYFHLNPANLLMYEAIRHACEMGYRWFDFNPSGGLDGVRAFKKSFGAETLACPVVARRAWWEREK